MRIPFLTQLKDRLARSRIFLYLLIILLALNIIVLVATRWPGLLPAAAPQVVVITTTPAPSQPAPAGDETATPLSPFAVAASQTPLPTLAPDAPPQEGLRQHGIMILSLPDGVNTHLFAYHPQYLPLTRLTDSPWDDVHPALSPNADRLAYASHQNGYWDIYLLDLKDGKQTRLTDTPEYDGAPTWSPDGKWLAYETYVNNNLEIYIRSLTDPGQAPLRLTDHPAADRSPSWSPDGQKIAFVSNRSGNDEIWVAYLQNVENRFADVSQKPAGNEAHPAWDASGQFLAYASRVNGVSQIYAWDTTRPPNTAYLIGNGDWPIWSPTGSEILSEVHGPNQSGLAFYQLSTGKLAMPFTPIPGYTQGMAWKAGQLADRLYQRLTTGNTEPTPALFQPILTLYPLSPPGRFGVVKLNDVSAPNPYLHDTLDESFDAMRKFCAETAGWDYLANLDNAYIPLTEPPPPGSDLNWLYTGRAFAASSAPIQAGWMVITREEVAGQTYWRLYLKARYQDGSQGRPLDTPVWNLEARYTTDPYAYEQGGQWAAIPPGYWVDFTDIALRFGWQRFSALSTWRTYYPATRFNIFGVTEGLDWNTAMSELYPPEALATPTPRPTRTRTSTPEPQNYVSPTPSLTPTVTLTATLHPTWTPLPPQ